jgi:microcystin-dependent protein
MGAALLSTGVRFANSTVQATALPNGTVAFWSGSIASIPTGWQLCDGTNGTPDLRDLFLVGAGATYAVGDTGGTAQVALASPELAGHNHTASLLTAPANIHTHTGTTTNTEASHNHSFSGIRSPGPRSFGSSGGTYGTQPSTGAGGAHNHPASLNTTGSHTHVLTATINNQGAGDAHENRPPYYALAFIMEVP